MPDLTRGLHESVVTDGLDEALRGLDGTLEAERVELGVAEAADRLALHLQRAIARAVESIPERDRVETGVASTPRPIERHAHCGAGRHVFHAPRGRVVDRAEVLEWGARNADVRWSW